MEKATLKGAVTLGQGTEPIQGGSTGKETAGECILQPHSPLSLQSPVMALHWPKPSRHQGTREWRGGRGQVSSTGVQWEKLRPWKC